MNISWVEVSELRASSTCKCSIREISQGPKCTSTLEKSSTPTEACRKVLENDHKYTYIWNKVFTNGEVKFVKDSL